MFHLFCFLLVFIHTRKRKSNLPVTENKKIRGKSLICAMKTLKGEGTMFPDIVDEVWTKPRILKNVEDIAKHWKNSQESCIRKRIIELKGEKKKRDLITEKEITQLVTRKLPFEYLAKDWLEEQKVS